MTTAALLMRTVGVPSCRNISTIENRSIGLERTTHVSLNLHGHLGELLLVADVAPVKRHASCIAVFHVVDVEHRHRRAAHAVHLGHQQTQPAGAARNDNDLVGEIDGLRPPVGDALVDGSCDPADGHQNGPGNGGDHARRVVGHRLGTQAERHEPAHERVEEGDLECLGDEIDRERREPRLVGGRLGVFHGECRE